MSAGEKKEELRDLIRDALQDSLGPDWTCDDGAKYVCGALEQTQSALWAALKRLTFAARTAGGTAGPDAELMAACDQAEAALQSSGASSG